MYLETAGHRPETQGFRPSRGTRSQAPRQAACRQAGVAARASAAHRGDHPPRTRAACRRRRGSYPRSSCHQGQDPELRLRQPTGRPAGPIGPDPRPHRRLAGPSSRLRRGEITRGQGTRRHRQIVRQPWPLPGRWPRRDRQQHHRMHHPHREVHPANVHRRSVLGGLPPAAVQAVRFQWPDDLMDRNRRYPSRNPRQAHQGCPCRTRLQETQSWPGCRFRTGGPPFILPHQEYAAQDFPEWIVC